MSIQSALQRLQGERPGMGSELVLPEMTARLISRGSVIPSISIAQEIQLADVSFWQGDIDFEIMREKLQGVIIRAGQRTWVDSRFHENWARAKAAGMPRGSYWFYDSREPPRNQAALWWEQLREDPGELAHVADFEESYGGPFGSAADLMLFLTEFQRLSGLPIDRIAIYTGFFWWMDHVGDIIFFKRYDLWIAWYGPMEVVKVPSPWTDDDLLFWQYTASGNGPAHGVSSQEIDLNWYCCDLESYKERFNLNGTNPPDNGGNAMYEGIAKPTSTPNVRIRRSRPDGGPDPAGMTIGAIQPSQAFKGDRTEIASDGKLWMHVIEVGGQPTNEQGWSASWLLDYEEVSPEPPTDPEVAPVEYTVTLGDDVHYEKVTITGTLNPIRPPS